MDREFEEIAEKYPEMRELAEAVYENYRKFCLSPFKELRCGTESIYDYVDERYEVPEKVIEYLKTTRPRMAKLLKCEHPFKKGSYLLGLYQYTDGKYYWDSDMWKYVKEYHVKLPEDFVEYIMSDEGTKYLKEYYREVESEKDEK